MGEALLDGALVALALCCAIGGWRGAACNLRYWRQTRHLPLVVAPAEDLAPVLDGWSWPTRRWPEPGGPGRWRLSVRHCLAYARIAERRARLHELVAASLSVVVGASLGLQVAELGGAWNGYVDRSVSAGTGPDALREQLGALVSTDSLPMWSFVLGVALVVWWPRLHRANAERARQYRRAAERQAAEADAPARPALSRRSSRGGRTRASRRVARAPRT